MEKGTNINQQNKFDKILGEKIRNYSVPVDENLWEGIQTSLHQKENKKIILWPWLSIGAAAVCFILIWILKPVDKVSEQISVEFYQNSIHREEGLPSPQIELAYIENSVLLTHPKTSPLLLIPETSLLSTIEDNEGKEILSKKDSEIDDRKELFREEVIFDDFVEIFNRRDKNKNSLSFYAGSFEGNLFASRNTQLSADRIFSSLENYLDSHKDVKYLSYKDYQNISHNIPLSVGITFRRKLNNYLSLESGLVYTYLYSKFENDYPKSKLTSELHYIGIPLNLMITLYSSKSSNINIYSSLGGMMEKGLRAHEKENIYFEGTSLTIDSKRNIDGLQWSLSLGLGVDYRIAKKYSVYLAPTISYYFDNNQPLNIRTENSLTLGINAGLRYSW